MSGDVTGEVRDFLDETNLRKLSRIRTAVLRPTLTSVDDVTSGTCCSWFDTASDVGRELVIGCEWSRVNAEVDALSRDI